MNSSTNYSISLSRLLNNFLPIKLIFEQSTVLNTKLNFREFPKVVAIGKVVSFVKGFMCLPKYRYCSCYYDMNVPSNFKSWKCLEKRVIWLCVITKKMMLIIMEPSHKSINSRYSSRFWDQQTRKDSGTFYQLQITVQLRMVFISQRSVIVLMVEPFRSAKCSRVLLTSFLCDSGRNLKYMNIKVQSLKRHVVQWLMLIFSPLMPM